MGIYDVPEMKLLVQSRTIDLNRILSYPFPYTLVMSVNSVTEKQVVVHAHTTSHFHNKFPCSCNSIELVSTFGTHFPTFGTEWRLLTLSLGFVEPDWEVKSGGIELAPAMLCYKFIYWFKLLGPIHQSFYFRKYFLGICLFKRHSSPLKKLLLFIELYSEVYVLFEISDTDLWNSKVKDEALMIRGQHLLTLAVVPIYISYKFAQMIWK